MGREEGVGIAGAEGHVVFLPDHRWKKTPSGLLTVLSLFSEVGVSGVWQRNEWYPFVGSGANAGSTT